MLKRTITLGELIMSGIVVVGAILGFWINTSMRLGALEINKKQQDTELVDTKDFRSDIRSKLDKLTEGQNEIKVTLQNKQDRK